MSIGCKSTAPAVLAPGNTAPAIDAIAVSDDLPAAAKNLQLSDYKGSVVLLNFWATWCGPCVSEIPAFEHLYQQLSPQGFVVVGVSIDDSMQDIINFKRKVPFSYPVFLDSRGGARSRYGISGVPESFVLDREGKFVLFPDLSGSGEPLIRLIGPRPWDEPSVISVLKSFLEKKAV